MPIDESLVRQVARLANLELPRTRDSGGSWQEPEEHLLNPEALGKLAAELDSILKYVDQIEALDLDQVEPTSHGVPLPPLLRDDSEDHEHLDTERALAGAPERSGDAFAVPKIIE